MAHRPTSTNIARYHAERALRRAALYRQGIITFDDLVNAELDSPRAVASARWAAGQVAPDWYRDTVRATGYVTHTAEGLARGTHRHAVTPDDDSPTGGRMSVCGRWVAVSTRTPTSGAPAPLPLVGCPACVEQLCDAFDPPTDDPIDCYFCRNATPCGCDDQLRDAELAGHTRT